MVRAGVVLASPVVRAVLEGRVERLVIRVQAGRTSPVVPTSRVMDPEGLKTLADPEMRVAQPSR